MDAIGGLLHGFSVALSPINLLFGFLGAVIGTIVGILPGLGPLGTMALLLSLTYGMDPVVGMILFAGIYFGAMYGGSTTSILLNIPGEAASVVTVLEGYKMARRGRAPPWRWRPSARSSPGRSASSSSASWHRPWPTRP